MPDGQPQRGLGAWLAERQLTPEQLTERGAGITADLIRQWEVSGEPPPEALPHLMTVAQILDVPLEHLDLGQNRRGIREGEYAFVIYARNTRRRGDRHWRAGIGAWGWPEGDPPEVISARVNSGDRAGGPTLEAALDALEAELRALVREHTRGPRGAAGNEPASDPSPSASIDSER